MLKLTIRVSRAWNNTTVVMKVIFLLLLHFVIHIPQSSCGNSESPSASSDQKRNRKEQSGEIVQELLSLMNDPTVISGILNCFENVTFWAEKEEVIFKLAKLRVQNLKEEIQITKMFTQDYETTGFSSAKTSERQAEIQSARKNSIASSGIAALQMIYRFVQNLQRQREIMALNYVDTNLKDILWNESFEMSQSADKMYSVRIAGSTQMNWPTRVDLAFAMHSLIHIQEVYNYNYTDLPLILCPETNKHPQLTSFHCAQIGLHGLYRKHYAVAFEWMELAVEKNKNENDCTIQLEVLESYLELTAYLHNKERLAAHASKHIDMENLYTKLVDPFVSLSKTKEKISSYWLRHLGGSGKPGSELETFKAICSGKDFQNNQQKSTLYCWYDKNSSAARTILPYKKELLSYEPEVIQVYDFIGDKLISALFRDKSNCSGISHTYGETSFSQMMRSRTATTCWPIIPELESLWKKISSVTLTDLSTGSSHGPFQVVDYLFGRFYTVHMDALQLVTDNPEIEQRVKNDGDRIYSMLFYLNDVPAGGKTPFPSSGTAAVPVKGSVVIWKNIYRNGSARMDTWHGSCPVIYGHKQVAVALLHSHSQFLTHPCTLNRYE